MKAVNELEPEPLPTRKGMFPKQGTFGSDPKPFAFPVNPPIKQTIRSLLFDEALTAIKLSFDVKSLEEYQDLLISSLHQNSEQTRQRFSQSLIQWFFPDGFHGLSRNTLAIYKNDLVLIDVMRFLYLSVESLVGKCVSEALFPLEPGMLVPSNYFDRFLQTLISGEIPETTPKRLKTNLSQLGFLAKARNKSFFLNTVTPSKTGFLLIFHFIFSSIEPRTVEMKTILANPFWKYLGIKSEDSVRALLKEANFAGLLGKYVLADQIEQVTTRWSVTEFLKAKVSF